MLLAVPGLLRNLPQPTLAAVVIAAALSLADIPGTVRLLRQRRTEFSLSIAAFLGVSLLGVLPGIAIAVALSICNVFRRLWWPYQTTLGRVPGLAGYHDVRSYPQAELLPGCVIFRFDAPLFFANARTFREQIRALAGSEPPPTWIVVAAEPITDVDTTAADMLEDLDEGLNAGRNQPGLRRDEGPGPRRRSTLRTDPHHRPAHFFPTLDDAITAFRAELLPIGVRSGRPVSREPPPVPIRAGSKAQIVDAWTRPIGTRGQPGWARSHHGYPLKLNVGVAIFVGLTLESRSLVRTQGGQGCWRMTTRYWAFSGPCSGFSCSSSGSGS